MKLPIFQLIVLGMCLIDIAATYNYINTFHNKFPNLDYKQLEANPILRKSWQIWGLKLGTVIGGIAIFIILTILMFTIAKEWQYFFAGTFSMMLVYHLLNWSQLSRM